MSTGRTGAAITTTASKTPASTWPSIELWWRTTRNASAYLRRSEGSGPEALDWDQLARRMRRTVGQDPSHDHVALTPATCVNPIRDARVDRGYHETPAAVRRA